VGHVTHVGVASNSCMASGLRSALGPLILYLSCSWLVHCDSRSERLNRRLALCKPGLWEQSQEACCFAHAFHAIPVRSVD